MTDSLQKLSPKDEALLALMLSNPSSSSEAIFAGFPENRRRKLLSSWEILQSLSSQEQKNFVSRVLRKERHSTQSSLLSSADSAWISDAFRGERASIWGVIMSDLPKARVGGILKDLPKETRRKLKNFKLESVPIDIQGFIRRRAAARFPVIDLAALKKDDVLKRLIPLQFREIQLLLRELGIAEMAMAFSKVNRSAIRAILNRLNTADAKELRKRIKTGQGAPLPEQRDAQLHILDLDLEKLKPQELVQEIGFGVFGKAFGKSDEEAGLFFVYKLPPRQGYVLKRYLDESAEQNTPEKITKTREKILDALTRSESGN